MRDNEKPRQNAACDPPPISSESVTTSPQRVIIVGENASYLLGGECTLPLHYFIFLRRAGVEAWLVVHERNRAELKEAVDELDYSRIHFASDTRIQKLLWSLPKKILASSTAYLVESCSHVITQASQRRIIRKLIREVNATVVHQPTPVSPRMPSFMHRLGAPVIVGPMNGGMHYPPSFQGRQSRVNDCTVRLIRSISSVMNYLIPGKRRAAALLVANERTRLALPAGLPTAIEISENGIDIEVWNQGTTNQATKNTSNCTRFAFIGRLVALKAVDLILHSIAATKNSSQPNIKLDILGEGSERPRLETLVNELGIAEDVTFHGFKTQAECAVILQDATALVLPSLHECGGAVVLEAMATGTAVIAVNWGGPADYLNASCGILVEPNGRQEVIDGFAEAMIKLTADPKLKDSLGRAGQERALAKFDWRIKIRRILEIYDQAVATSNLQTK